MDAVAISFIAYTAVIMGFGIFSARFAKRSSSDFFLAGRGLGAWVAALSSSASAESGWVLLGLTGMAFKTGVGALWVIPGTVLAFLFNWYVLANRLRKLSAQHNAITTPDILAVLHPGRPGMIIRLLSMIIIVFSLTLYVAIQFTAAGKAFDATFNISYVSGVAIGTGIVLVYTFTGGFRAVAWTDVLQAILMVAALVGLPIAMIVGMGGFGPMLESLKQDDALSHPFAQNAGMALIGFLVLWLGIPLHYPGQPHILVRFMATRDEKSIRRGAIISTVWVFFLFLGAIMLGICARALWGTVEGTLPGGLEKEKVLPFVAAALLPGVLSGIVLAAVIAAICSTADSQLLVSASALSHDLFKGLFRKTLSDRVTVAINRSAVLLVGATAMGIALMKPRGIFDSVLFPWSAMGSAFGPGLVFSLFWKRTTAAGVIAGMLVGFGVTLCWLLVPDLNGKINVVGPSFFAALITVPVVSLLTPPRRNGS